MIMLPEEIITEVYPILYSISKAVYMYVHEMHLCALNESPSKQSSKKQTKLYY